MRRQLPAALLTDCCYPCRFGEWPPPFYGHCHKPTALTAALACAADRVRPRQRPGQRHQGRDPGLELVEFLKRDPAAAARHSRTLCLISVLFIVNAEHIFT